MGRSIAWRRLPERRSDLRDYLMQLAWADTKFEQFGMKFPKLPSPVWYDLYKVGYAYGELKIGSDSAWDIWRVANNRLGIIQARAVCSGICAAMKDMIAREECGFEAEDHVTIMWHLMRHPTTRDINVSA